MAYNYSVVADFIIDPKSINEQVKAVSQKLKGIKLDVDSSDASKGAKNIRDMGDAADEAALTFQAANAVFRKSVEVITAMVDQVYELDSAVTDFKKVSDLSGKSLDKYVEKLSAMGDEVARTGKPKV